MIALALALALGAAGPNPFLAEAKVHLENLDFEKCLARLEQASTQWKSTTAELRDIEVHAGLCTFNLGQRQRAEAHFRTALRIDPAAQLPPYQSPKAVELFDQVKAQLEAARPFVDQDMPPGDDAPREPKLVPGPRPPETTAFSPTTLRKVVPLSLGGAGLATAIAAVALGLRASAVAAEANGTRFESDFFRLGDEARGLATAATVLWSLSGALAASAVLSWFLVPEGDAPARTLVP